MAGNSYYLPKLDDLEIIKLLREFHSILGQGELQIKATIGLVRNVSIDPNSNSEIYAGKFSIDSVQVYVDLDPGSRASLRLIRHGVQEQVKCPIQAVFAVEGENRFLEEHTEKFGKVSTLLNNHVVVNDSPTGIDSAGFTTALGALTARHHEMMSALSSRMNELEDDRTKWSQEKAEEQSRQAAEFSRQRDAIAEERRRLQLDSPRAERRKILDSFTDKAGHLAEDVKLGNDFVLLRFLVFCAALASGILFALIALSTALTFSGGSIKLAGFELFVPTVTNLSDDYMTAAILVFKSTTSTVISVGSFLLAVNWLRSFQEEEARNARDLSRFKRDLIRASWIIETVQEINSDAKNGVVPAVWLERATHGMFEATTQQANDLEANTLKSLLQNSSKVSLGPDGAQITINKKGAKNLADEI